MKYTWDSVELVYRDETGKEVNQDVIRTWIDDTLALIALLFLSRAEDYRSGDISFQTLNDETEREIAALHYACAAIAFGGLNRMSTADQLFVEAFILDQLAWFRAFMFLVYTEQVSSAQTAYRITLYVLAGYGTYENSRALNIRQHRLALVYRRLLTPGNNCEECIEYAFRGWRLIGTLPGIGQQCSCRSNCRCRFQFSANLLLLS